MAKNNSKILDEYKETFRKLFLEDARKGFMVHLLTYVILNFILIYLNPTYNPEKIWFVYPLAFWGLGLLMHYVSVYWFLENRLKELETIAENKVKSKRKK